MYERLYASEQAWRAVAKKSVGEALYLRNTNAVGGSVQSAIKAAVRPVLLDEELLRLARWMRAWRRKRVIDKESIRTRIELSTCPAQDGTASSSPGLSSAPQAAPAARRRWYPMRKGLINIMPKIRDEGI